MRATSHFNARGRTCSADAAFMPRDAGASFHSPTAHALDPQPNCLLPPLPHLQVQKYRMKFIQDLDRLLQDPHSTDEAGPAGNGGTGNKGQGSVQPNVTVRALAG